SRQILNITYQQAEKDYKMADFYRRTDHPGSAYFYFELVRRRYPNTKFAEMAAQQMAELKAKLEKEGDKEAKRVVGSNGPSLNAPGRLEPAPLPRSLVPGRDAVP